MKIDVNDPSYLAKLLQGLKNEHRADSDWDLITAVPMTLLLYVKHCLVGHRKERYESDRDAALQALTIWKVRININKYI